MAPDVDREQLRERVELERAFRSVALQLELTSCGVTSAARLTVAAVAPRAGERVPATTKAFESGAPVTGDWSPPHVFYRRKWAQAATNDERRELLDQARKELRGLRHAPPPARVESEEARTRRLLELEGWTADDVALHMRMTPTQVRKARTDNGRDPERGELTIRHKLSPDASPAERAKHAVYLNEVYGLGPQAIAPLLGVHHRQVSRYLKTRRGAAA